MKLIAYIRTNWGKDFPSTLEDHAEAKKYVSAFYYALNPVLKELSDGDEHIMRSMLSPGNSATPTWDSSKAAGDPDGPHDNEATQLG